MDPSNFRRPKQARKKIFEMIYLNEYSVRISPGREVSDGYVIMKHGDVYTITLRNASQTNCDAEIFIAGNSVGKWRIHPYKSITLERPAHDDGRFTFYRIGTEEFSAIGGEGISKDLQGLIEVAFTPEKYTPASNFNSVNTVYVHSPYSQGTASPVNNSRITWTTNYLSDSSGAAMASAPQYSSQSVSNTTRKSMVPGETGLSGKSNQVFGEVPELDYDLENQIKIRLRLVIDSGGPRPLVSRSNPVPPPV